MTIDQAFHQAVALHQAGQLQEAERLYHSILQTRPKHPDANHNLGVLAIQMRQPATGLPRFKAAVEANPSNDQYWQSYINGLIHAGLIDVARMILAQRWQQGLRGGAVEALLGEIGTLESLFTHEQFEEAAILAQSITVRFPTHSIGWKGWGTALQQMGRAIEALTHMQKAVALLPSDAEAHTNIGIILMTLNRLDEAEASCRQALQIKPDYAEAYNSLGSVLLDRGQNTGAVACFRQALALKPDYATTHYNLGVAFRALGQLVEAEASFRQALKLKPDFPAAHSNLLFTYNLLANLAPQAMLAEARLFGELAARKAPPHGPLSNPPDPAKCLRIGLVSGDFRNHPVAYFLEGVLAKLRNIASGRLEFFAYSCSPHAVALTERIKTLCRGWHSAVGQSDAALAQKIRNDGIDILIDLSGHTEYNRLPMFAWKPAPVQVSWLGYFATTGVAEIDYVIADPWVIPEAEEVYFTEKVWRLPETRLCFTPPDMDVEISSLSALSCGYVTFGCFNNLAKVNEDVVSLWARVLAAVPGSRLFLKAPQLGETSFRQRTVARFAVHGIEGDRLILEGSEPRAKYLAAYHRVDIALDTFPFPGGTTSVEGLWMGVPVLTLAGERFLSRQGVGILMNAGLPEWVAADADDYVAKAVSFAGNLPYLAKLRKGLRQQVLASPIMDAQRFAIHFEAALRDMWRIWCGSPRG